MDWVSYLLVRSNTRNSALPFNDPAVLGAFLMITTQLLPATRISVEVTCAASSDISKAWREVIARHRVQGTFIDRPGANRARLRVSRPGEGAKAASSTDSEIQQPVVHYSTPLLRIVAHVLAIRLMTVAEIRSLQGKKKNDFQRLKKQSGG